MPQSWASTAAIRKTMLGNRSRDTKPELALRRLVHARGLRYRVCSRPLPELRRTVDIVFRPAKVAVELRGCFWHVCPEHYQAPAANSSYWARKAETNAARDRDTQALLEAAGWALIVVWEHEDLVDAADRIARLVRDRRPPERDASVSLGPE